MSNIHFRNDAFVAAKGSRTRANRKGHSQIMIVRLQIVTRFGSITFWRFGDHHFALLARVAKVAFSNRRFENAGNPLRQKPSLPRSLLTSGQLRRAAVAAGARRRSAALAGQPRAALAAETSGRGRRDLRCVKNRAAKGKPRGSRERDAERGGPRRVRSGLGPTPGAGAEIQPMRPGRRRGAQRDEPRGAVPFGWYCLMGSQIELFPSRFAHLRGVAAAPS